MKISRLLALGAALCLTASAQATEVRPGLWEFRSTRMNIAGLPDLSSQMGAIQQHIDNLPPDTRRMIEQQMAARGVSLGKDGSVRSCITPEQAKQDAIYSGKTEGNCTLADVVKTPGTVTGRVSCTQPTATGHFEARIDSPERFTTRVNLTSAQGDMRMETAARWIAAECKTAQRAVPRATP